MTQFINRILVIRRDNIGDLICTTPLLSQLRQTYPQAQLDILVNSYNYAAIALNPDVNKVYAYTKGKHREAGQTLWRVYWQRFQLLRQLKHQHYDVIILAGGFSSHAERLAQQITAPIIIGFPPSEGVSRIITHPISTPSNTLHEVERTNYLLTALALEPKPSAIRLCSDPVLQNHFKQRLTQAPWYKNRPIIGLHISARKVDQRWSAEYFIDLIQQLHQEYSYQFMLFWSPGDESHAHHPGDNQKAQQIIDAVTDTPLLPCPTHQLAELIAAMSLCDAVICSDGGAMHIAAGLGKPIVCFFGSSNAQHWHPWGVPHVVLQPDSQQVMDIKPLQVEEALATLIPNE